MHLDTASLTCTQDLSNCARLWVGYWNRAPKKLETLNVCFIKYPNFFFHLETKYALSFQVLYLWRCTVTGNLKGWFCAVPSLHPTISWKLMVLISPIQYNWSYIFHVQPTSIWEDRTQFLYMIYRPARIGSALPEISCYLDGRVCSFSKPVCTSGNELSLQKCYGAMGANRPLYPKFCT